MKLGNARAQHHWQLRYDLQYGDIGLPDDAELIEELLAIKSEERRGLTYIVDKDDLRSALGRSPNKADAVIYGNFVRNRDKKPPEPSRTDPFQHGRDTYVFVPYDDNHPAPDDSPSFSELPWGF